MKNSFESRIYDKIDADKACHKAEKVLSDRINESDFIDIHGGQEVAEDIDRVSRLEEEFKRKETRESAENKKFAEILEAIISQHGELSEWFGSNATTICASKFDDFVNGVDMIVEFNQGEDSGVSHLALGMDVTFTSDTTAKFDRLRSQIESGGLTNMKYFSSERLGIVGKMDKIPEVIIGVDRRMVQELMDLWLANDNDALANHRVQVMILEEIKAQLTTFAMYARSLPDRDDLVDIYEARLQVIKEIIGKKGEFYKRVASELDKDPVYFAITDYMRRWQKIIIQLDNKLLEEKKESESPLLSLKESLSIQRDLIIASGIEAIEWIPKYAERFRVEITKDASLREMIRNNPQDALSKISSRLYDDLAARAV